MRINRDILWLAKKYAAATKNGKSAIRLARQLKLMIDANEIYLIAQNRKGIYEEFLKMTNEDGEHYFSVEWLKKNILKQPNKNNKT